VDTVELARYLIGRVVGRLSGRIVETEAYPVGDSAGHAFRGETRRNASLFFGPGHAYVYFTYGSSFMLNVSSEATGVGAGVLLRALEFIGVKLIAQADIENAGVSWSHSNPGLYQAKSPMQASKV
jgi:DNA-3-methyladenine glycosylase